MAARQGVRSADLYENGIVDRVIPEFPDAAEEPVAFCTRVGAVLREELGQLTGADTATRLGERARRFDLLGRPDHVLAQAG